MCDLQIPRQCKRPPYDSKCEESGAKMAAPPFKTIKNNLDKISARMKQILNDPKFKQPPGKDGKDPGRALRVEFENLMKKKANFIDDLKATGTAYEDYQKEIEAEKQAKANVQSVKKLNAEELKKFMDAMRQRAKPKKSKLLGALTCVNHALMQILDDSKWCKNKHTKKRFKELVKYRMKICKRLMNYPQSLPDDSFCFRFAPCKIKYVKAWQYDSNLKRRKFDPEILNKRRIFKFDHDEDTKRIGMPRYRTVCDIIKKYNKFIKATKIAIDANLVETVQEKKIRIAKLKKKLDEYEKRKKLLVEIKKEFDESQKKKVEVKASKKSVKIATGKDKKKGKKSKNDQEPQEVKEDKIIKGVWDKEGTNPFTHNLEVPWKRKISIILKKQKKMLEVIEKHERMYRKPIGMKQAKAQASKKDDTAETEDTSEITQEDQKPVDEEEAKKQAEKAELCQRNKGPIRSFKIGLQNNIKFLENYIKTYPEPTLKQHKICKLNYEQEKSKEKERKIQENVKTHFDDECTQKWESGSMLWPRYRTLKENFEKYNEMIKKFEADMRNSEITGNYKKDEEDEEIDEATGMKRKVPKKVKGFRYDNDELKKNVTIEEDPARTSQSKPAEEPSATQENVNETSAAAPKWKVGGKCHRKIYGKRRYALTRSQRLKRENELRIAMYKRLMKARDLLKERIEKHDERFKGENSQSSTGYKFYFHNKKCNFIPKTKKPKEYPIKKARKEKAFPKPDRIRYALRKREEWIDQALKIKYGVGATVEKIHENLKKNVDCILPQKKTENVKTSDEVQKPVEQQAENKKSEPVNESKNQPQAEKSKQQKECLCPGMSIESRLTPYLCRYVRQKFTLEKLLKEVEAENVPTIHDKSHENADKCFFPEQKLHFKFKNDAKASFVHARALAKPKKSHLKGTLEEFSQHLSDERREGLKSRLGSEGFRPEDFETSVRVAPKPKPKIRNLACKIKNQVSKQIYDQLARDLKRKIAKEMAKGGTMMAVTEPMREVQKNIKMFLVEVNGVPRSIEEGKMYDKFTCVVSEFLLKSLQKSL